jgi:hypothetical protein
MSARKIKNPEEKRISTGFTLKKRIKDILAKAAIDKEISMSEIVEDSLIKTLGIKD